MAYSKKTRSNRGSKQQWVIPPKASEAFVAKIDFSLSLNPETFGVGTAKLPEVDDGETPRVLFEERIALLRDLSKTLDGMFGAFLKLRQLLLGRPGQQHPPMDHATD